MVHPIPDGSNIRNKLDRSPCHLVVNSCIKFRDNMGGKLSKKGTNQYFPDLEIKSCM